MRQQARDNTLSDGTRKIQAIVGTGAIDDFCLVGDEELPSLLCIGDRHLLRSHTVVYAGSVIGNDFITGHFVLIREHCTIGDNVSIGSFTEIAHDVKIGNNVRIHSQCFIPEDTIIEDNAWIGPRVCFTNDKHPGGERLQGTKKMRSGVYVEHDAVIGANATLLPGIRIGHHAMIGAGAVVTKSVPPYMTVVGNPARQLYDNH